MYDYLKFEIDANRSVTYCALDNKREHRELRRRSLLTTKRISLKAIIEKRGVVYNGQN